MPGKKLHVTGLNYILEIVPAYIPGRQLGELRLVYIHIPLAQNQDAL
jgi:hypothetical protein